jgi:NTP pyrophosphatase (non-canonical NTP hydrolase)
MKYLSIYKRILKECGYETQALMCIEEMSELTKALCKFKRYGEERQRIDIVEELADVLNMAEQLKVHFGAAEVEKVRKVKIDKFLRALDSKKRLKE